MGSLELQVHSALVRLARDKGLSGAAAAVARALEAFGASIFGQLKREPDDVVLERAVAIALAALREGGSDEA